MTKMLLGKTGTSHSHVTHMTAIIVHTVLLSGSYAYEVTVLYRLINLFSICHSCDIATGLGHQTYWHHDAAQYGAILEIQS